MAELIIAAGKTALAHIRKNGLTPDDISTIFGASGAAKWLAIAGLDHKVFARFMTQRTNKTPVDLFGTSVGAFKLAGAARQDADTTLKVMADAYIAQSYEGKIDLTSIDKQTDIVFEKFMGHGMPVMCQKALMKFWRMRSIVCISAQCAVMVASTLRSGGRVLRWRGPDCSRPLPTATLSA